MKRYVIERDIPGVGKMSDAELGDAAKNLECRVGGISAKSAMAALIRNCRKNFLYLSGGG